ncbi:hypothetical protein BpHYR1_015087 [Brachionus plicatilis]|uniref:Transmembrane protein n=1 Tax=Brachionus plicatilis TaxID=10195 RepID=A0A3M7QAG5_BRAPC|nr:hypothetical protein BpHYR1_015087 [Brachionus plicatilis]
MNQLHSFSDNYQTCPVKSLARKIYCVFKFYTCFLDVLLKLLIIPLIKKIIKIYDYKLKTSINSKKYAQRRRKLICVSSTQINK